MPYITTDPPQPILPTPQDSTLPSGGTKDQVLTKLSGKDQDAGWKDSQGGGGPATALTTLYINIPVYELNGTAPIPLDFSSVAPPTYAEMLAAYNAVHNKKGLDARVKIVANGQPFYSSFSSFDIAGDADGSKKYVSFLARCETVSMFGNAHVLFDLQIYVDETGFTNRQGTVREIVDFPVPVTDNAAAHNSIYRGKLLGENGVTQAQWDAIQQGTFADMYIGDYWTFDGDVYRIASFNYFINRGDVKPESNHVVIMPDKNMFPAAMHSSAVTTQGYAGCTIRSLPDALPAALATVEGYFGADHIMTHREFLITAAVSGKPSAGGWFDCKIELPNTRMVMSNMAMSFTGASDNFFTMYTVNDMILPLMLYSPTMQAPYRAAYWLRDIFSSTDFLNYSGWGLVDKMAANTATLGVRPYFCIKAEVT